MNSYASLVNCFVALQGNAHKKATEGQSSANFTDDQPDDGKTGEFDGFHFPHSENMKSVSSNYGVGG